MHPFWIATYKNGARVMVYAESREEAERLAFTPTLEIHKVETIPYPTGGPHRGVKLEIHKVETIPYPTGGPHRGVKSGCPTFCWDPRGCAGRTSCPKRPSCVD